MRDQNYNLSNNYPIKRNIKASVIEVQAGKNERRTV